MYQTFDFALAASRKEVDKDPLPDAEDWNTARVPINPGAKVAGFVELTDNRLLHAWRGTEPGDVRPSMHWQLQHLPEFHL